MRPVTGSTPSAPARAGADAPDSTLPAPEADLVARIREGDREAFSTMFLAHHVPLCRIAYRYVLARDVAEELVHDVFLAVWVRRAEWVVSDGVRQYLTSAVRHRALSYLKHQRVVRRAHETLASAGDDVAATGRACEADTRLAAEEAEAAIRRALAALPERQREVLLLRWQRQLSNREIAQVMGISEKTVEIHVGRALKVLRSLAPAPGAAAP